MSAVETVTVGFDQTSYSTSEDGPLNVQVCAEISNLLGDLECNLVVTFNAVSNNKSGKVIVIFNQQCDVVTSKYILRCTVDGEDFTVGPPSVFEATFVAMSTLNGGTADFTNRSPMFLFLIMTCIANMSTSHFFFFLCVDSVG